MDEKDSKEKLEKDGVQEKKFNTSTLLNILLGVIVVITVVAGGIIYYSLYTYSNEEIIDNTEAQNTSMAEIINAAISQDDSNTVANQVGSPTVSTGDADSRKVLNESIIVLYDGLILDAEEMGIVDLKYIDNSNTDKEKYVVTYYNYENYGFKNSSLGTLSSQVLEGLVKIDNVGKVSISEKYEAIPREVQVVNTVPSVVLDNNADFANYDTTKTLIIDLDGDGTNEYIVVLANKQTGESRIVLVEATGLVKDVLGYMDKSGWDSNSINGYYLSYSNIEVIDIDNDGIMEILFEIPTLNTVPNQISVLKYKNGELSGKTNIQCSLVK